MPYVLLVEDSKTIANMFKDRIESELNFSVIKAKSMKEAKMLIENTDDEFFISILDLNLPDAPDGEIVDYVLSKGIPAIVVTGNVTEETRDKIWTKQVVDYVMKEGRHNLEYIISTLRRIYANQFVKVLVVDDSKLSRDITAGLLSVQKFIVFKAQNGKEALELLKKNSDIKLVITDCNMPEMDGIELTNKIRQMYTKEQVGIIGISAMGSQTMSARFIKHGANDFLQKPFQKEEFYCRVTQNITMIEYFDSLKESESRYRELADSLPLPVFETDLKGRLTFLNNAGLTLWSIDKAAIDKGTLLKSLILEGDRKRFNTNFEKALNGSQENSEEYTGVTGSGDEFPLFFQALPIFRNNNLAGLRGYLVDMTDSKKAEYERLKKEKLQGALELAGAACHEINQPLQVIQGFAELIQNTETFSCDNLKSSISLIKDQVNRLNTITDKLQHLTQYETMDYLGSPIIDINKASEKPDQNENPGN